MKKFNPEKELYKIQHGNRNKIIFGVIALLLTIGISSSYALYQVRYTKRIIYNKVNGFSNVTFSKPDNVTISPSKALLLSGETKTFTATLPDNNKIDTVTCTNSDSSITSDNTFSVTYKTNKASVCTITIKQSTRSFSDVIIADNSTIFDDDPDGNLRYAGPDAEVNNYIWFNCDDYDFTSAAEATSKNCEKWRIIGLFKNITKTEGGQEDLVKIIRDSVGTMKWDSNGENKWTKASLKPLLEGYYNGTALSSATGIKESTKDMIEQVTWNLNGPKAFKNVTAAQLYTAERGSTPFGSHPISWDGYIGLMYPSDYGYATAGGSQTDRDACLAYILYGWNSGTYKTDCAGNDWLFISGTYQWTLSPRLDTTYGVFYVGPNGNVSAYNAYDTDAVRPSLYLKSDVQIADGKGTSDEPYVLMQAQ